MRTPCTPTRRDRDCEPNDSSLSSRCPFGRRCDVERTDRLLKRLRISRLDNSHDAEIRKLLRVDLLILGDFALTSLDSNDTSDIYELVVERHRNKSTIITSNREPIEWIALMAASRSPRSIVSSRPRTNSSSKATATATDKNPASVDQTDHQARTSPSQHHRPLSGPI